MICAVMVGDPNLGKKLMGNAPTVEKKRLMERRLMVATGPL